MLCSLYAASFTFEHRHLAQRIVNSPRRHNIDICEIGNARGTLIGLATSNLMKEFSTSNFQISNNTLFHAPSSAIPVSGRDAISIMAMVIDSRGKAPCHYFVDCWIVKYKYYTSTIKL